MEYAYNPTNWLSMLKAFGAFIQAPVDDTGTITIPPPFGDGFIRAASPEEGFSYLIINASKLQEEVRLQRMTPATSKTFILFFLEMRAAEEFSVIDVDGRIFNGHKNIHCTFFSSSDVSRTVVFPKNAVVKMISTSFTSEWLAQNVSPAIKTTIEKKSQEAIDVQFANVIQNNVQGMMNEIFDMENLYHHFMYSITARIFMLTETFLRTLENE